MKAYVVETSFELILAWLRNGHTPLRGIEVDKGVPDSGRMISLRANTDTNSVEFLFLTDEPGSFPEACDIWQLAERVYPRVTIQ